MDVPFISSGAISRSHYTLVRRVESADSPQLADQYLLAEVQSTRQRLDHPSLSLKQCKECLVILLYCSMSITSGGLVVGDLDFALPHAVNLAEAGRTSQHKRIGYLFCDEIMPADHELQLMLINTIRKDLESSAVSRICLALDKLIISPTREVIPAVQSRLRDLLSHNSSHVRRRALLAFRALSHHDPELMKWISSKLEKRLHDSEPAVVTAALITTVDVVNAIPERQDPIRGIVTEILLSVWSDDHGKMQHSVFFHVIRSLRVVGLLKDHLHVILGILRLACRVQAYALLYQAFLLLSDLPLDTLTSIQTTSRLSPVHNIRSLLTSQDLNDQYLFISCLECLDPRLWAGTTAETPSVMEAWEVEKMMYFLDSPDALLRKKTLKILHRIDVHIVGAYYSQSSKAFRSTLSVKDKNEFTARLLDVIEIQCSEDGELYARKLSELFGLVDIPAAGKTQLVLEKAVEKVLLYVRKSDELFRIGCVTTLVSFVVEISAQVGPTLVVIISALASEYCGHLAISPVDILQGLGGRLSLYTPAVQEACLLSMLRIVAEVEEVPPDVVKSVTDVGQVAKQHIRRRCDQFVNLCGQKQTLSEIVSRAQSPSLPDFLGALETQISESAASSTGARSPKSNASRSPMATSPRSLSTSKLRYVAYEPPKTVGRLHHPISSRRSSSSRSTTFSDAGHEFSRTVTAGDLALAAGDSQLELMGQNSSKIGGPSHSPPKNAMVNDLIPRVDLITLDSPFISHPSEESSPQDDAVDFERVWDALASNDARGWYESSIDVFLRRLESLNLSMKVIPVDQLPFEGEMKILLSEEVISSSPTRAALRLRSSDDESCLWRLRCDDDGLRTRIKRLLTEV